jgi:hypothetical protein
MNDVIFDDHYMLECSSCLFRLPLPIKDEKQIQYMFCANCDTPASFKIASWTNKDMREKVYKVNVYERIRKID